jgi:hypothetical protein
MLIKRTIIGKAKREPSRTFCTALISMNRHRFERTRRQKVPKEMNEMEDIGQNPSVNPQLHIAFARGIVYFPEKITELTRAPHPSRKDYDHVGRTSYGNHLLF